MNDKDMLFVQLMIDHDIIPNICVNYTTKPFMDLNDVFRIIGEDEARYFKRKYRKLVRKLLKKHKIGYKMSMVSSKYKRDLVFNYFLELYYIKYKEFYL